MVLALQGRGTSHLAAMQDNVACRMVLAVDCKKNLTHRILAKQGPLDGGMRDNPQRFRFSGPAGPSVARSPQHHFRNAAADGQRSRFSRLDRKKRQTPGTHNRKSSSRSTR
jgi:hypothetical protein